MIRHQGQPLAVAINAQGVDACIPWTGRLNNYGYGMSGSRAAHRVVYERVTQQAIPADLTVDHLCFNTACQNVRHMEIVTWAENLRRAHARRTALRLELGCKHNHGPQNNHRQPSGRLVCLVCRLEWKRRSRELVAA